MHTEHLQNVRPSWVAFGWFIGAAMTAFLLFALIAVGLVDASGEGGSFWVLLALFAGYVAGGYLTGARVGLAPILHAVGIGLFSVVVWFLANLVFGEPLGADTWGGLAPEFTAGVVILQIFSAAVGARLGSRQTRAASVPTG
jgi:ABC-type multidrug transport system permease subunit